MQVYSFTSISYLFHFIKKVKIIFYLVKYFYPSDMEVWTSSKKFVLHTFQFKDAFSFHNILDYSSKIKKLHGCHKSQKSFLKYSPNHWTCELLRFSFVVDTCCCFFENQNGSFISWFKGSPNPSHFIFEINVGRMRIRHITTLNLNLQSISSWSISPLFNSRVVVCRIRSLPTLISKIKWLRSGLSLVLKNSAATVEFLKQKWLLLSFGPCYDKKLRFFIE